jgi:hypothetical protein
LLAELGINPEDAAVTMRAAKEALLAKMPAFRADAKDGPTLWEAATLPSKNTGIRALNELLAEGKVQRIGRGCRGNVYRYFAADLVRTKRELA